MMARGWSVLPAAPRRVDTTAIEHKPIINVLTAEEAAVPEGNTHS